MLNVPTQKKALSRETGLLNCLFEVTGPWDPRVGIPNGAGPRNLLETGHHSKALGFYLQSRGTHSRDAVADYHLTLL